MSADMQRATVRSWAAWQWSCIASAHSTPNGGKLLLSPPLARIFGPLPARLIMSMVGALQAIGCRHRPVVLFQASPHLLYSCSDIASHEHTTLEELAQAIPQGILGHTQVQSMTDVGSRLHVPR